MVACVLGGCDSMGGGGTAWLPLDDKPRPGLFRLSIQGEPPLDDLPGPVFARRTLSDQRHALYDESGSWIEGVVPGAYVTADGVTLIVREGDGVAQHALSMLGIPVALAETGHERAALATNAQSYDALSLFVHSWRLADQKEWPWVNSFSVFGGLLTYLERLSPQSGLLFDPAHRCYVDSEGRPVRIGGDVAQPGLNTVLGDIVSADDGQEVPTMGILSRDLGRQGFLDPEDIMVTTQQSGGAAAYQVEAVMLGNLLGERPIHVFRRDSARLEQHLEQRLGGDNPIWELEAKRVWLVVAGMVILTLTLLRLGRNLRRKQRVK